MKKKKGFTLVELIATMAVMGIVTVMIINIFSSTVKINDFQEANCDTVQNLKIAQAKLYNDIRKSVITKDPVETVPKSGIYTFPAGSDEKIVNANSYCIAKSLRPLIYIVKIDNSIVYYAYGKSSGTLHMMTIPAGTSESVVLMYYPNCYDLSNQTQGKEWDDITDKIDDFKKNLPPDTATIPTTEVVTDNIVITEKIDDTSYIYNSFSVFRAYKDPVDNKNKIVLYSSAYGKYFLVKLTDVKIGYYKDMKDEIVARGIKKGADGDAISITPNTTADITTGKYYEIHIDGKIGKSYNYIDTRVSLVNYGINGGI